MLQNARPRLKSFLGVSRTCSNSKFTGSRTFIFQVTSPLRYKYVFFNFEPQFLSTVKINFTLTVLGYLMRNTFAHIIIQTHFHVQLYLLILHILFVQKLFFCFHFFFCYIFLFDFRIIILHHNFTISIFPSPSNVHTSSISTTFSPSHSLPSS